MPTSTPTAQTVVVLGASDQPDRYSHQAVILLTESGHRVIPVHPSLAKIAEIPVCHRLEEIAETVHTLTLYLNPARLESMQEAIRNVHPQRVIFNPGTKSTALQKFLTASGIPWIEACTLVLLRTGQF